MAPHWYVLGAGSIGSLFASKLHRAGCGVTLLTRPGEIDESGHTSLTIATGENLQEIKLAVSAPGDTDYISHLLITTKAYDARPALANIAHRLDEHSHILLLVNGMGILEELGADHPTLNFYCGTSTEGAYRTSKRAIVHAGTGTTKIGHSRGEASPAWFADWAGLSAHCIWDDDILTSLWQKLAVNCAINPLSALNRCNNGELLARADLAEQLNALCREISQVAAATGHTGIATNLQAVVNRVISNTADNRSSMLQDVLAGRRTEIEYITAYLVNTARQLKVATPLNSRLLNAIREVDR